VKLAARSRESMWQADLPHIRTASWPKTGRHRADRGNAVARGDAADLGRRRMRALLSRALRDRRLRLRAPPRAHESHARARRDSRLTGRPRVDHGDLDPDARFPLASAGTPSRSSDKVGTRPAGMKRSPLGTARVIENARSHAAWRFPQPSDFRPGGAPIRVATGSRLCAMPIGPSAAPS